MNQEVAMEESANSRRPGRWTMRPPRTAHRKEHPVRASSGIQAAIWLLTLLVGGLTALSISAASQPAGLAVVVVTLLVAFLAASAVRLTANWERAIVLRLGKF